MQDRAGLGLVGGLRFGTGRLSFRHVDQDWKLRLSRYDLERLKVNW